MDLSNQNIGPYGVEAEIGRGGMGVVYRAVDNRLGRTVAIKALPEDLAEDPERLARFEREARTMAALNHPNVAGIHGVEEHEGRKYLILEYVDGETLAERLDRGPLALDEALDVCAQIAAGIDAAHEAGIIHRDLKPANVKLTLDGKVKVLDFGLAKAAETQTSSVDVTQTPTITGIVTPQTPTLAGVILGTAPYMSPEQARGRPVDRRSDIWSFGVVLYECLTGISPFAGETVSDSIAAILQNNEADLDRLPPAAPPPLRRVVRRCLERDRDRRFRDIGDVRLELLEVREGGHDEAPAPHRVPGRSWWAALAALLVAAVALTAWMGTRPSETPVRLVADIVPQDPGTEISVRSGPPAVSPDGSRLAFAVERGSEMSLIVRDLGTGAGEQRRHGGGDQRTVLVARLAFAGVLRKRSDADPFSRRRATRAGPGGHRADPPHQQRRVGGRRHDRLRPCLGGADAGQAVRERSRAAARSLPGPLRRPGGIPVIPA